MLVRLAELVWLEEKSARVILILRWVFALQGAERILKECTHGGNYLQFSLREGDNG